MSGMTRTTRMRTARRRAAAMIAGWSACWSGAV